MAISPFGWVALLGVAVAEGFTLSYVDQKYIEPEAETIADRFERFLAPYWHKLVKAHNEALAYEMKHNIVVI